MKVLTGYPKRIALFLLVAGVICIGVAASVYFWTGQESDVSKNWKVTMTGVNGEEKVLSYEEIKGLPPFTGRGGFFTTTGVINGPYKAQGVSIGDLCSLVGGLTSSDLIKISAADGYSTILNYDQVNGDFITYDPVNMKEKSHGELKAILMYLQDGAPLSEEFGKPLRLAVVGVDGLLTEGLYWIKWINQIEVIQPKQSTNAG